MSAQLHRRRCMLRQVDSPCASCMTTKPRCRTRDRRERAIVGIAAGSHEVYLSQATSTSVQQRPRRRSSTARDEGFFLSFGLAVWFSSQQKVLATSSLIEAHFRSDGTTLTADAADAVGSGRPVHVGRPWHVRCRPPRVHEIHIRIDFYGRYSCYVTLHGVTNTCIHVHVQTKESMHVPARRKLHVGALCCLPPQACIQTPRRAPDTPQTPT